MTSHNFTICVGIYNNKNFLIKVNLYLSIIITITKKDLLISCYSSKSAYVSLLYKIISLITTFKTMEIKIEI